MAHKAVQSAALGNQIAVTVKKTHLVGVSLDIDLFTRLKAFADAEDRPHSDLAKALLRWAIDGMEKAGGSSRDFLAGNWTPPEEK